MTREDKEEMGRLHKIIRDRIAVVKMQDENIKEFIKDRRLTYNIIGEMELKHKNMKGQILAIVKILEEYQ